MPATALTLARSEGVKKGILEAVEKMALDQPPPFTSGMSGIEMLENAGLSLRPSRSLSLSRSPALSRARACRMLS